MRLDRRIRHERLHAAKAFSERDQVQMAQHRLHVTGIRDLKGKNPRVPARLLPLRRVPRMIFQAWVKHFRYLRMRLQEFRDGECIAFMPFHPKRQCLHSTHQLVGIGGA
ncbi:hypothetical protein D3C74_385180 [compost metagenome]